MNIHRMKLESDRRPTQVEIDNRAERAYQFRFMYRSIGMDMAGCAKFLQVSVRTLHNWISCRHDIPFAAFKLMRLMTRSEMPGKGWEGWCFHGNKLWTPEGFAFEPKDGAWWSLTVRQARMFGKLFRERVKLEEEIAALRRQVGPASAARPGLAPQASATGSGATSCPFRPTYRLRFAVTPQKQLTGEPSSVPAPCPDLTLAVTRQKVLKTEQAGRFVDWVSIRQDHTADLLDLTPLVTRQIPFKNEQVAHENGGAA